MNHVDADQDELGDFFEDGGSILEGVNRFRTIDLHENSDLRRNSHFESQFGYEEDHDDDDHDKPELHIGE